MGKVVTFDITENFIERLADYVDENFIEKGADISRFAFVFEGKRPSLFLKRAISKRTKKSYFPPKFFSIDEFVQYTLAKKTHFEKMSNMESRYIIYNLAKDITPEIVKGREKFSQFLPWAKEIADFIDTLDTEDIPTDSLKEVQASAAIGYDIPENINMLLEHIVSLRDAYHKLLSKQNSFSRGFIYLSAAKTVEEVSFDEFDNIFFCSFFYMQKAERKIAKYLYDTGKAGFFFQGDEDNWQVLKNISHNLSCSIKPTKREGEDNYSLNLYSGFDRHSQVSAIREILKKIKNLDSTVIVLPDPNSMIPLVSEIGSSFGEFNVSLGYPLRRSSLYFLFESIVQAQKARKDEEYYVKDYIDVLRQPLVKNLKILPEPGVTRILVHKLEEALLGIEDTPLSGRLFVKLKDIENEPLLFELAANELRNMDIEVRREDLRRVLKELHLLSFTRWEDISNFRDFASSLGKLLDVLVRNSFMEKYGLNLKIAQRMYSIIDELQNASFSEEEFAKEDIFKIFRNMLENEMVAFRGSPLKGLQILGILETRALNFENVIIMDVNESILPKLRIREPLIPHDVSLSLGLDIVGNEEEMQRYQFMRIISAAKNVHLVYEENPEREKSRFVEELVWRMQKKKEAFDAAPMPQVGFSVNVLPSKTEIKKTKEIVEVLKNFKYSASSVDMYVQCPLRFYYKHVLGLKEKEEFPRDPEGREIGIFIHELLKEAFTAFIGKKPRIDGEFRADFFEMFEKKFSKTFGKRMRSDSFLLEEVMRYRFGQFLNFEEIGEERKVEEILYLEKEFKNETIEFSGNKFNFTYIVDRVDKLEDGSILIVDYKTGTDTLKPQRPEVLENMELKRESVRDRIRSFQLPLYYYFEKKKYKEEDLNAALYSLRNLKLTYLGGEETDVQRIMEICLKALNFILHEILDLQKPFAADREKETSCQYCPFFYLCR
jgi:hypothetical protein